MRAEWLHCFLRFELRADGYAKKCRGLISQIFFFAKDDTTRSIEVSGTLIKCQTYEDTRHHRCYQSIEFVIGGYTPGKPLDSVVVGYYDGGKLIYAAKVRNGFVPRLRREVWNKLKRFEIATCPFANLPEKKRTQFSLTREEMKSCVWLKPKLVAQIEFTEWTPDGHLRHSKFAGLRDDKDPRRIVREFSFRSVP